MLLPAVLADDVLPCAASFSSCGCSLIFGLALNAAKHLGQCACLCWGSQQLHRACTLI